MFRSEIFISEVNTMGKRERRANRQLYYAPVLYPNDLINKRLTEAQPKDTVSDITKDVEFMNTGYARRLIELVGETLKIEYDNGECRFNRGSVILLENKLKQFISINTLNAKFIPIYLGNCTVIVNYLINMFGEVLNQFILYNKNRSIFKNDVPKLLENMWYKYTFYLENIVHADFYKKCESIMFSDSLYTIPIIKSELDKCLIGLNKIMI